MNCNSKCIYAKENQGIQVCTRGLEHTIGKYEFWHPEGGITCLFMSDGEIGIYPIDIKYCDMITKEINKKSQPWFD